MVPRFFLRPQRFAGSDNLLQMQRFIAKRGRFLKRITDELQRCCLSCKIPILSSRRGFFEVLSHAFLPPKLTIAVFHSIIIRYYRK
jgi:hypothetical protein